MQIQFTKRYIFITVLIVVLAGAVLWFLQKTQGLFSLPRGKVYTIGIVRTPPTLDHIWEGFREGMRELGYEEGKDVAYKVTEIGKEYAETKQKVAILIEGERLDLLYVLGIQPARAGKEITQEKGLALPIIFGIAADPVGAGLVEDLRNSGNNLTGISSGNEIISSKRLELFLEMVPGIKRVIMPWSDPITSGISLLRESAKRMGVTLVEKQVTTVAQLDVFLSSFEFRPGDALFRATDNISALRAKEMAAFTLKKEIPFAGTNIFDVEQGALMSYGADYREMGKQAAGLARRILARGDAPSSLPIEPAALFELIVNLNTAEKLGMSISPAFLARVDRILR